MDGARGRLEELLDSQPLGVIATAMEGAPYASLVALAHDGVGRVYFATTRATHKWANLAADPRISVLVDDRSNSLADFHEAAAATGLGRAVECEGADAELGRGLLLERHPHLRDFLASPTTAVLCARMDRWYLVTRFQSVEAIECAQDER